MKHYIIIAFCCLITLTNCSVNSNDDSTQQVFITYWHLRNVSGGIAGVDIDFELNDIVWNFDEINGELMVNNTNTNDAIEDGLNSGTYTFSVEQNETNRFLIIDSNEFGGFTISQTQLQLIIDQNITSTGSGADGFVYTFQRITVAQNSN